MVDYLAPTTANGSWGVYPFSHPLDNDNTGNTFRVNNTVKYAADFAGFSFGGTYSFSNDTGFANNRQWSVGAQYEQGGLLVGAAFLNADNPGATSGGAIAGRVGRRRCELCVGAAADFRCGHQLHGGRDGRVRVHEQQRHAADRERRLPVRRRNDRAGDRPARGGTVSSIKYQNFEVNGKYQFTPALFVGAQYVYTTVRYNATTGSAKPKIHSLGLMADYNLSKRTDVYLMGAYQRIAGDATASLATYVPGAADLSSTSKQLMVHAGIRHKF